jgi:hydroxymethylpyrimidine/phosphomethylpyrimidine kinase
VPAKSSKQRPVVLSIAGYDPSSGAGVTADIKTIAAHGCYGISSITALTVQSTLGVRRVVPVSAQTITATLEELAGDFAISAVKIGMLGSAEAIRSVARFLKRHQFENVILDPVLVSSSGTRLLARDGVQVLRRELLKLADVITPNIDEATSLTGVRIGGSEDVERAAQKLHELGVRNVVVTGGHLKVPTDFLSMDFGARTKVLTGRKVVTRSTHGTGCAFSTALACNLASGKGLLRATAAAKKYVSAALKSARPIGKGIGPVV